VSETEDALAHQGSDGLSAIATVCGSFLETAVLNRKGRYALRPCGVARAGVTKIKAVIVEARD